MPLPALPLALPPGQLDALRAAYATPPRAYHDFGHVAEVLRHYAEVAAGPGWMQPREVALAVLYHDAIYQAGHGDNEARSARLAVDEIARWLPDAGLDAERVAWLIGLTARHGRHAPADFDMDPAPEDVRNFLDCDMAILGAEPARFDAYDEAIAIEYRGVLPAWLFRRNRRRFLESLLARERIYLGEFFHARLEQKARRNLRRALSGQPD
jgi:predicted metal-dependent HD superfamily phosphohydrolase